MVEDVRDEVVGWRRHLHENPELSFEEEETAAFVEETLKGFGGMEISRPTPTSVVARLVGGESEAEGPVIALRADIDALPIHEETGLEFASRKEGVMHACGHDGHTAILLGGAKVLASPPVRAELPSGELRFVFQHAEEQKPGGAEELVEAGVMDGVDAVIGLHLAAHMEVGRVGVRPGPALPASDTFEICVRGSGGHAAWPHESVDSVAVAAQVVTNLQHIVARGTDPLKSAVLTVSKISGGSAPNVIPDSVELVGTVRVFDEAVRDSIEEAMERVVRGVTEAHGATYSWSYQRGYRPVVNDEGLAAVIEESVRGELGDEAFEEMRPKMAGDDFSAYQQVVPGAYFFVGARNEEEGITHPHHHPRFDIDERSLHNGLRVFLRAALALLDAKPQRNNNGETS